MAEFRSNILIVEDDTTLLESMKRVFTKAGFVVHGTGKIKEAQTLLETKPIGTLFVDCLMPEQSGVEFVESIRAKFPPEMLEVILMSGIFTDSGFVKDSLRSTRALHFLKKPFDLQELLQLVEKPIMEATSTKVTVRNRKTLYSFFAKGKVTAREKRKAIESLDEIHGFDLPFIYNLIVESKTSGHLNIAAPKGEVYGISFSGGSIVAVDIPDKATYLGNLLVSSGYVDDEDIKAAFNDKTNRKFGEKLVQSYSASPHAILMSLGEQMNLRLSKTIIDQNVSLNFVEAEVELISPSIDAEKFSSSLHDWISSKISVNWLKAHFVQWTESTFVKTNSFRPEHPALQTPLVQALPGLVEALFSGTNFGAVIDAQKFAEEPFFKAIHYLLTRGVLAFSEPPSIIIDEDRKKLLRKLKAQLNGKNKLEIFDIIVQVVSGTHSDPESALNEFHKILGVRAGFKDKELLGLHDQLSIMAKQAFEIAKSGDFEKLKEEFAKVEAENKMKAAHSFEEAKTLLLRGSFKQAMDLLKVVKSFDPNGDRLRLYMCWAQTGLLETLPNKAKVLKEIEMDLLQVPPEEKLDAIYNFIQGLVAKANNDSVAARRYYSKAIALDKTLNAARRELSLLEPKVSKGSAKDNMFEKDLKEVFGSIFKRKSG